MLRRELNGSSPTKMYTLRNSSNC